MIFIDPESQTTKDIKKCSRTQFKFSIESILLFILFYLDRYDSSFPIFFVNFAIQKIKYSSWGKLRILQRMDKTYQVEKN